MPEEIFWKSMTPARLHALLNARFRPAGRPEISQFTQTGEKQRNSLAEYFMTGGGG